MKAYYHNDVLKAILLLVFAFIFNDVIGQNKFVDINNDDIQQVSDHIIVGYYLIENDTVFILNEVSESMTKFKDSYIQKPNGIIMEESLATKIPKTLSDKINSKLNQNNSKLSDTLSSAVLLKLWFSKCKPCLETMDDYLELGERINTINILGLTFDSEDVINSLLDSNNWTLDNITSEMRFMQLFSPLIMPKYVVINESDQVVYVSNKIPSDKLLAKLY